MNAHDFSELVFALDYWAKNIESNAAKSGREEFEKGRASTYRNLAAHIRARGDLSGFINTAIYENRRFGE